MVVVAANVADFMERTGGEIIVVVVEAKVMAVEEAGEVAKEKRSVAVVVMTATTMDVVATNKYNWSFSKSLLRHLNKKTFENKLAFAHS